MSTGKPNLPHVSRRREKEHIVKLKPNITEALLERLKEYAKITYVDEQDEKLRQELTQIIEQSKQEAIDTANNFTISHTDEVKNDILNIINQTSDDLKEYCDNKCKMTLSAGKNYTDAKADEINQRIDEEHEYNRERYVIGTINKDGLDTDKRFTEIGLTPNKSNTHISLILLTQGTMTTKSITQVVTC